MKHFAWFLVCGLLGMSSCVFAQGTPQCETNFKLTGSLLSGRQFTTWADVNASQDDAFKRVYLAGAKSGLKVVNSDKSMGAITFEQTDAGSTLGSDDPVSLTWNVLVEANGSTSKVTVTQSTPPGYTTSKSTHIKEMCLVIQAAAGTLKSN